MKELNGYLIVEVPEGARSFESKMAYLKPYLFYWLNDGGGDQPGSIKLPRLPKNIRWEIVEFESVVHNIIPDKVKEYGKVWLYNDYETGKALFTALESFESWKRKEGFKNVVILKRK